ncbi:MAG: twin-arginine translocase TatA/TatE family subunit [Nitrospirota bacterium]
MFGLGVTEIILISAIALIFFGPSGLPQLGKNIGSALRNFRGALSREEGSEKKRVEL